MKHPPCMKHISFWASRHIWLTRLLIFLIYILLNAIGWITGDLLNVMGIELNHAFILVCITLTIVGLFIYPTHNKKISSPKLFRIHKTADIMLASATFLFIVFAGNRLNNTLPGNSANGASMVTALPKTLNSFTDPTPKSFSKISKPELKKKKHSFREWRKNMKAALKEIRQAYRQDDNSKRITLVVVSIIVGVILILLLAALSCSLACSGAEALAFILLIFGVTGIVFGLVRIIKNINKKYKKVKPDKEPTTIQT